MKCDSCVWTCKKEVVCEKYIKLDIKGVDMMEKKTVSRAGRHELVKVVNKKTVYVGEPEVVKRYDEVDKNGRTWKVEVIK